MKTHIIATIAVAAILASVHPALQAQRPRVSPHESVTGTVDGARVTIVYGRPSMRGRTIFGKLVPYDVVWCPGADEATTIDSPVDLMIGSLHVPAGPHTVWILPTPNEWTLIISKDPSGFHTRYYPNRDLGRVPLAKERLASPIEQLTFAVDDTPSGGTLSMEWEQTRVSVPFTVVK